MVVNTKEVKFWAVLFILLFSTILIAPSTSSLEGGERTRNNLSEWTFIMYMAGDRDNDISSALLEDLNEMKIVGSTANVSIVVLIDEYDDDSKVYFVERDHLNEISLTEVNPSWTTGEVNTGSQQTLTSFAQWAMENYPAKHYFLDLAGHGRGWNGLCHDGGDVLSMVELSNALADIKVANNGSKLDIIGFDACSMGTVEVYYQLIDYADYVIASEIEVDISGWPYDVILQRLENDANMSAASLCSIVVNEFVNSCQNNSRYSAEMCAVELEKLEQNLTPAINTFAANLKSAFSFYNDEITFAKNETEHYERTNDYDLYHFAENVLEIENKRIQTSALDLMSVANQSIIAEKHWTNPLEVSANHTHGMSIWFSWPFSYTYRTLKFSKSTMWDEFIEEFYSAPPRPEIPFFVFGESKDTNNDTYNDTIKLSYEVNGISNMTSFNITMDIYNHQGDFILSFYNDADENGNFTFHSNKPNYYHLYCSLFYNDELQNYSQILDLNIQAPFYVHGNLTDLNGKNIEGAEIIFRNMRTNEILMVLTNETGYNITILQPDWCMVSDKIEIRAVFNGHSANTTLLVPSNTSYAHIILILPERIDQKTTFITILWIIMIILEAAGMTIILILYISKKEDKGSIEEKKEIVSMRCISCGSEVELGTESCPFCGEKCEVIDGDLK